MSRRRYHEAFFDDDDTFSSKKGRPDRDTVESLLYRIGSKDTEKIQRDISELSLLVCNELTKNPEHYARIFASWKRRTLHVRMLRVWDSDDPHPQEDYLSCLWAQISSMRSAGWKEHVLSKISDAFPALKESGQSCKFSQVRISCTFVFRMFDYTDVYSAEDEDTEQDNQASGKKAENSAATLPGAHTVERFLIDEKLHIILETMNFNKTRARVALDYMIVEAIFADIFRLPKPPVRHGNLLFYASLLIQLCNEASNTMPLVLAQAAETLFDRLDTMKPLEREVNSIHYFSRFVEWFSFHLTNYQLQWSWQDWSRALSEPLMSPRRWLISETLRRLIRLVTVPIFQKSVLQYTNGFHDFQSLRCLFLPVRGWKHLPLISPASIDPWKLSRISHMKFPAQLLWQLDRLPSAVSCLTSPACPRVAFELPASEKGYLVHAFPDFRPDISYLKQLARICLSHRSVTMPGSTLT
ncbi:unnamed protein product [Dibothriocephalus latus]|uniref:MIF4G-like type 1 domain-containing protein n=1 Tax=Dibothriocephalus latus TaxID=60516 RepID=A0A3P7LFB5_DIBLA|nr:unnamed protein product [Dibothriocephalus latus]